MAGGEHGASMRSWLVCGVILAGFIVGGIALILSFNWPMFWAGVGLAAIGTILARLLNVMDDVEEYGGSAS